MKDKIKLFLFFMIICFLPNILDAQEVKGKIYGTIIEMELNRVIPTATVSVYSASDSSILNYTLTDGDGIFRINNLPIDKPLYLVATFVGYGQKKINFKIPGTTTCDLGKINLIKSTNILEEVVITGVPPIKMNGDTLEFNADAFKMDPNAVAEDLLKKLPGVVVWGDGTITVNGKEISNLLVNGKRFFGGDTKIATQNIEKNAIKKIQVYQKETSSNSIDSISEINIQLKNQKSLGYFGKLTAGKGTGNTFEYDANINAFNKRTQLSALLGKNNINKESNDITKMIRNSTYKGSGLNREYETDFTKPGNTESLRGGFLMAHDFKDNVTEQNKNTINVNYLYNNSERNVIEDNNIVTTFSEGNIQERINRQTEQNKIKLNKLSGGYEYSNSNFRLGATAIIVSRQTDRTAGIVDSVWAGRNKNLLSNRNMLNSVSEKYTSAEFGLKIEHIKNKDSNRKRPDDWFVDYKISKSSSQETLISNIFFSSIDTLSNFFANRRIPYFIKETNQRLAGKWGNFWNLLATPGYDKYLFLTSDLNIINRKVGNTVFDIDSIGHESKSNDLSYDRNERIINWIPGLSFEKTYLKMLSDRYQKTVKIVAAAKYNIYDVRNRSDRNFQNFDRYFTLFSPEISFNYRNLQFGEFENVLDLKYNRSFDFPTTDQLFPVVDTTQIYSLYLGNPELKPSRKNEILLEFKQKRLNKNPFSYGLSTGMNMTKNYISYSMLFDSSGRTIITPTNVDRNRSIIFRGNFARAIKFKKDQLQFKIDGYWSASEVPFYILYITGQQSFEKSLNSSMGIEFNTLFSHLDIFYLGLNYTYKNLFSRQNNDSEKIKSEWHKIEGNTLINVSRRLSFVSNFAYYDNKFYGDNQHYSIFNIKVSYRMLKKNNLEASLSGNDILNQNRLFTVKNIANTLSQQRTNAMGRFFMLSLAYYPRMFGKNNNK